MSVKIIKRNSVIYNSIFFVLLSPLFLHLIISLDRGTSVFDFGQLKAMVESNLWLFGGVVFLSFILFRAYKFSLYLFAVFVATICGLSLIPFVFSFNKLLLFLATLYLLTGFYFFVILKLEFEDSIYRPAFNWREIGGRDLYGLKVEVKSLRESKTYIGFLTNWDPSGFFVHLNEKSNIRGKLQLKLFFENQVYQAQGVIASRYDHGYGVRIVEDQQLGGQSSPQNNGILSWPEYYDIITSRGYKPSYG